MKCLSGTAPSPAGAASAGSIGAAATTASARAAGVPAATRMGANAATRHAGAAAGTAQGGGKTFSRHPGPFIMRELIIPTLALLATLGMASAAPDVLIADFEQEDFGGWQATGNAFGTGPARGALSSPPATSRFPAG